MTRRAVRLLPFVFLLLAANVSAAQILEQPYDVRPTFVSATTVIVRWQGSGPTFWVLYKTGGFPTGLADPNATQINAGSNYYAVLPNLTPSTTYYIFVYAHQIILTDRFSQPARTLVITRTGNASRDYFVDANNGNDANPPGDQYRPLKTITHAMTFAVVGDRVLAKRGTYRHYVPGGFTINETFPIQLKSGVQLMSLEGPAVTIIDAQRNRTPAIGCNSCAYNTVLEGFTITGGEPYADVDTPSGIGGGGGIFASTDCYAVFRRNIIIHNTTYSSNGTRFVAKGGGIYVENSAPWIESNVIAFNIARGPSGLTFSGGFGNPQGGNAQGGGIWLESGLGAVIVNNTFYGNSAIGGNGSDAGNGFSPGGDAGSATAGGIGGTGFHAFNNILAGNSSVAGTPGGPPATPGKPGFAGYGGIQMVAQARADHDLFWGNVPDEPDHGTAAVNADPLFSDAARADFRLSLISPARSAGTPSESVPLVDLDNDTRPSPPAIGAVERPTRDRYEFHGDFNADGKDDILGRDQPGGYMWMLMLNGATVVDGGGLGTGAGALQVAGIGDFDGDGRADILFRDPFNGDIGIWFMNGTNIVGGAYVGNVDPRVEIAGIGDFNGDGKADILFLDQLSGTVAMWLMNGSAIIGGGSAMTGTPLLFVAGVGDFNGDGKDDILWRNHANGDVGMWLMNGISITAGAFVSTTDLRLDIAGVADFNGDGKADVLFRDMNGDVGIWFMNGPSIIGGGLVGGSPMALSIVSVGDYNGDGRADILWFSRATGDAGVWLMNGTTIASGGYMGNLGPNEDVH